VKALPRRKCRGCVLAEERPDLHMEFLTGRSREHPHSYENITAYLTAQGFRINKSTLRDHYEHHSN
jgi:hypothetical protein